MSVTSDKQWLTTGGAAGLCCVKRDTVLKWIRRGRLQAARTIGGHYRIERQNLWEFLPENSREIRVSSAGVAPTPRLLRCWEYHAAHREVRAECRSCVAFEVGASRCFRLRSIAADCGRSFCTGPQSCEDCSYYRRVMKLPTRVLIVCAEPECKRRVSEQTEKNLEIRVVDNGYEASAALSGFGPGYVVLDTELQDGPASALLKNLARDNRLHGPKVVLATAASALNRKHVLDQHEIVVARISKPIEIPRLLALIEHEPVEALG